MTLRSGRLSELEMNLIKLIDDKLISALELEYIRCVIVNTYVLIGFASTQIDE
jgi:hypothetical protein